jgi:hypothetical protein
VLAPGFSTYLQSHLHTPFPNNSLALHALFFCYFILSRVAIGCRPSQCARYGAHLVVAPSTSSGMEPTWLVALSTSSGQAHPRPPPCGPLSVTVQSCVEPRALLTGMWIRVVA